MLKINLLPPYIYDRAKKRNVAMLWAAVVVGLLVLFVVWAGAVGATLAAAQRDRDEASAEKDQYTKIDGQINTTKDAIAATKSKEDFVASAQKYNDAWPNLFDMVRDVTSDRILLEQLALAQDKKTLEFTGFAPTEMDIVRWLIILRNNKDKFTNVHFNLPPHGYVPGSGTQIAGGPGFGQFPGGAGFGGPGGIAGRNPFAGANGGGMAGKNPFAGGGPPNMGNFGGMN
ncbi:MAG TPA: hypothetical protein VGS41_16255, partial [Chthonomonadales bacterium]|nr:hypothetical protein [Chthonomonadales bacterium]